MNNFPKTIRFPSSQVTIYMRAVDSLQKEGSSTFCIATDSAQIDGDNHICCKYQI